MNLRTLEEARQVCSALTCWRDGEALDQRQLGAALAVAHELEAGDLHDRVKRAARVFDEGIDDDDARAWIECIFEIRLALEEFSMGQDAPALIDALACADQALDAFGSAVLLVRDEEFARLSRNLPLDEETWWGKREALEQRVAEARVKQVLSSAVVKADVIPFPAGGRHEQADSPAIWRAAAANEDVTTLVRGLRSCAPSDLRGRFAEVLEALEATPCPWLRRDVKLAVDELEPIREMLGWRWEALREAVAPVPGRVPVLLYLPERHEGVLLELRVARSDHGLWSRAEALMPVARDAIRRAHAAVAASSDTRQPRFVLEQHTIDFVGPTRILDSLRAIDGTSLALPSAIAFASLWLGRAPAWDIASTGGLEIHPDRIRVTTVGSSGLDAKIRALSSWTQPIVPRLLVARAHDETSEDEGVERIAVSDLADALTLADLRLDGASSWAPLGDQATRIAELDRSFHELRTQDLRRHRISGANPWAVLGDRMQLLATSLVGSLAQDDPRLRQADAYVALARAHAGDMQSVGSLPEADDDPSTPPGIATVRLLSSLVRHIGAERFEGCDAIRRALDDKLAALHPTERHSLQGMVRGTQGRSFLHDRRLTLAERVSQALPLLEESVSHHERFQPVEVARSRIYLAMALRTAGRCEEAAEQLDRAGRELESITRPWSGAYHQSTRTYWLYERARLNLVMGSPNEALEQTAEALKLVDEQNFWPAIGILRTRAWAFRMLNDPQGAQQCVKQMQRLEKQAPESTRRLIARIVEEAAGEPRSDGEVY